MEERHRKFPYKMEALRICASVSTLKWPYHLNPCRQTQRDRQRGRRQETDVAVLIGAFGNCFMKLTVIVTWHCVKRNAL